MIVRMYMDERMNFGAEVRRVPENGDSAETETAFERNHMCDGIIHVVQRGDTLYRISRQYHVSISDIMYKNPYANVYNLQAGDEICIPVSRKRRG
ncbi:MAG: LysM domain-containing protein [Clostridiales bacterium]|nr:LysM domain-containing protein [Clostridiales bacterium]